MLFHRYLGLVLLPAALLLVVALVRMFRRGSQRGSPRIAALLAFASAASCSGAGIVLRFSGYAYAVKRDSPTWQITEPTRRMGNWALSTGIFGWSFGVRVALTLLGVGMAIAAIRHRPRWTGIIALLWCLASVAELVVRV